MNRGPQYSNKYRWLHDERFLKDLEGDSVDSEILEDELRSLQYDGPATCRTRLGKLLESNPLQVVLCVLVLVDAGIVVAEMLLDLHSIRGVMKERQYDLDRLLDFVRYEYTTELNGYRGANITEILTRIKTYQLNAKNESNYVNINVNNVDNSADSDYLDGYTNQEFLTSEDDTHSDNRYKRSLDTNSLVSGYSRTSESLPVDLNASPNNMNDGAITINSNSKSEERDNLAKHVKTPQLQEAENNSTDNQLIALTVEKQTDTFSEFRSSAESPGIPSSITHLDRSRIRRDDVDVQVSQQEETPRNNCRGNYDNCTTNVGGHGYQHIKTQSELLHEIAHYLHFCSIAILGIFVLQVFLRVVALDLEFFRRKMEIFDAIIIIASFAMDLIFLGGIGGAGEEAAALIILFLLWRILRVVNGILVTAKQRQEFRMKLQKRARRRAERKIEMLQDDKHMKEKEISSLKELCMSHGASTEDIRGCKPRRVLKRLDTSSGLTSVASLSLSLSMSMSTGIFGNIVSAAKRESSPFSKHKNRSSNQNRRGHRDGSLTPRSAQGSMEDLKSRSQENLLSVKPREKCTTIREMDSSKDDGVLEPLVNSVGDSGGQSKDFKNDNSRSSKPPSPICDIIVTIDETGTSVKNDVRPQTPNKHNQPTNGQSNIPSAQIAISGPPTDKKHNGVRLVGNKNPPEIIISDDSAVVTIEPPNGVNKNTQGSVNKSPPIKKKDDAHHVILTSTPLQSTSSPETVRNTHTQQSEQVRSKNTECTLPHDKVRSHTETPGDGGQIKPKAASDLETIKSTDPPKVVLQKSKDPVANVCEPKEKETPSAHAVARDLTNKQQTPQVTSASPNVIPLIPISSSPKVLNHINTVKIPKKKSPEPPTVPLVSKQKATPGTSTIVMPKPTKDNGEKQATKPEPTKHTVSDKNEKEAGPPVLDKTCIKTQPSQQTPDVNIRDGQARPPRLSVRFKSEIEENEIEQDSPVCERKFKNGSRADVTTVVTNCDRV